MTEIRLNQEVDAKATKSLEDKRKFEVPEEDLKSLALPIQRDVSVK